MHRDVSVESLVSVVSDVDVDFQGVDPSQVSLGLSEIKRNDTGSVESLQAYGRSSSPPPPDVCPPNFFQQQSLVGVTVVPNASSTEHETTTMVNDLNDARKDGPEVAARRAESVPSSPSGGGGGGGQKVRVRARAIERLSMVDEAQPNSKLAASSTNASASRDNVSKLQARIAEVQAQLQALREFKAAKEAAESKKGTGRVAEKQPAEQPEQLEQAGGEVQRVAEEAVGLQPQGSGVEASPGSAEYRESGSRGHADASSTASLDMDNAGMFGSFLSLGSSEDGDDEDEGDGGQAAAERRGSIAASPFRLTRQGSLRRLPVSLLRDSLKAVKEGEQESEVPAAVPVTALEKEEDAPVTVGKKGDKPVTLEKKDGQE